MEAFDVRYRAGVSLVLQELEQALCKVEPAQLEQLKNAILAADKVFFVGVGRVLLALEAMAKRLGHLGVNAHIVGEICEPAITDKDLLIVGSGSGSSLFPVAIAKKARALGATVAHIGANPRGDMAPLAHIVVRIPVQTKLYLPDEVASQQPMTSLFEQALLLLGDVLAKMLIDEKQLDMKALWAYHANLE